MTRAAPTRQLVWRRAHTSSGPWALAPPRPPHQRRYVRRCGPRWPRYRRASMRRSCVTGLPRRRPISISSAALIAVSQLRAPWCVTTSQPMSGPRWRLRPRRSPRLLPRPIGTARSILSAVSTARRRRPSRSMTSQLIRGALERRSRLVLTGPLRPPSITRSLSPAAQIRPGLLRQLRSLSTTLRPTRGPRGPQCRRPATFSAALRKRASISTWRVHSTRVLPPTALLPTVSI